MVRRSNTAATMDSDEAPSISSGSGGAAETSKAWVSICVAHAVRCLTDRSWNFFLPLYLSKPCGNSLRSIAAVELAQGIAITTLSTTAATAYRSSSRPPIASFTRAVTTENVAIVLTCISLSMFAGNAQDASSLCEFPLRSPLFWLAILFACIGSLCSSILTTIISKEWVGSLYRTSDSEGPSETEGLLIGVL